MSNRHMRLSRSNWERRYTFGWYRQSTRSYAHSRTSHSSNAVISGFTKMLAAYFHSYILFHFLGAIRVGE